MSLLKQDFVCSFGTLLDERDYLFVLRRLALSNVLDHIDHVEDRMRSADHLVNVAAHPFAFLDVVQGVWLVRDVVHEVIALFGDGVSQRSGVLDSTAGRPFTHLTSLDVTNAFNTLDRCDIGSATKTHAPPLYRLAK